MTLAEQEAERRGIDELLLVIFEGGVAHQRRHDVCAFPPIEARRSCFLLQKRATLVAGMIQVLAPAEIMRRREPPDA